MVDLVRPCDVLLVLFDVCCADEVCCETVLIFHALVLVVALSRRSDVHVETLGDLRAENFDAFRE
jgi:hypothetical protein